MRTGQRTHWCRALRRKCGGRHLIPVEEDYRADDITLLSRTTQYGWNYPPEPYHNICVEIETGRHACWAETWLTVTHFKPVFKVYINVVRDNSSSVRYKRLKVLQW